MPLDEAGDGLGGQLKPIAEFSQPAAPQPAAPAALKPTAAPAPAVAPQPPTPAPARPNVVRLRAPSAAPSLSLRKPAPAVATQTSQTVKRSQPFDDNALALAWRSYIDAHSADTLLANTMRASLPVRDPANANALTIRVENMIQVNLVHQALPSILAHLHGALANDEVTLQVMSNAGETSPATWNEREVLAHLIKENPAMQNYVTALNLTLN